MTATSATSSTTAGNSMSRPARLGILLAALTAPLSAQTVAEGYEVGTWHGFRDAAVTHTFDDNLPSHTDVVVPLFDEFGLKATFFVTTNWVSAADWPEFAAAAADGHEIAAHTLSHPNLSELSVEAQRAQLEGSRDAIEARISGAEVLTLAYPFCVPGDRELTEELFIAARVCSGRVDSKSPTDFYQTSSFVVGSEANRATAASLNAVANDAARSGGWANYLTHAIGAESGYSPIPAAELRSHVEYLADNLDRFWVATYADVVRYIRERDAASVTELVADYDGIVVEVTDDLDDAVYDVPLTLRRPIPDGWPGATAVQGTSPVRAVIVEEEGVVFVEFDAVPDAGPVTLTRTEPTSSASGPDSDLPRIVASQPNPSQNSTTIVYELATAGPVTIEVFDALGRRVDTLVDTAQSAGRHRVVWDGSPYGAGTYTVRLRTDGHIEAGQVTLTR